MKKKRISVEQIVAVLKEAEAGVPASEVIRKAGISERTFYRRKKQHAGLESDQDAAQMLLYFAKEQDRMLINSLVVVRLSNARETGRRKA